MGDAVATMVEWFQELIAEDHAGADRERPDWLAWRTLLDDLPVADQARVAHGLVEWYEGR